MDPINYAALETKAIAPDLGQAPKGKACLPTMEPSGISNTRWEIGLTNTTHVEHIAHTQRKNKVRLCAINLKFISPKIVIILFCALTLYTP